MMEFKTLRLTLDHIAEVAELEKICFSSPISEGNLKALLIGGIGDGFVSIETKSAKVAAYGGVIVAAGEAQVLNVAVDPEFRRLGLGRNIMERIIELSQEREAEFITLEVREHNFPAVKLYESLGFYIAGRIKGYYKNPSDDALILKKDLIH